MVIFYYNIIKMKIFKISESFVYFHIYAMNFSMLLLLLVLG
jgi:hypothetical protein